MMPYIQKFHQPKRTDDPDRLRAYGLVVMTSPSHNKKLYKNIIIEYLDIIELKGITPDHKKEVERSLNNYLKYLNYNIDKIKSIKYFKKLKDTYSIAYYKKQMYQIRKFLTFLHLDWINNITLPPDPIYTPKRIGIEDINNTLSFFKDHSHYLQLKTVILLGSTSGLRAEEIYQLNPEDIDIRNRIVRVNHNPNNGQTTKTQTSRVSFFNIEAQNALSGYFNHFNNGDRYKRLFSQTHLTHLFRDAPIKVKYLRKFFSQEWDRRGGPTSIKKILMGHSMRNDVDLMHYNCQSEEDLKKIYDKIMVDFI